MGNVTSRPGENTSIYLKDQNRLSLASLRITNARKRVILNISPNGFPATRFSAKRDSGDESVVDYVQDPELSSDSSPPPFLLRFNNDDEIHFNFTFVIRQQQNAQPSNTQTSANPSGSPTDTSLNGVTFVFASNLRELDNLVTREFHADPNLHKNANVELVGDYKTGGSPTVQFEWSWHWKPPKAVEDRGGGWRTSCCLVEYDQRAHRLNTLASFSFWVHNSQKSQPTPGSPLLGSDLISSSKLRVPSTQSVDSRASDDQRFELAEPPSPNVEAAENGFGLTQTTSNNTVVACQRPGEDMSTGGDGPVFRATMKALEQKTGNMRIKMKKVLKKAEAAQQAQVECNDAAASFIDALREASRSNANAIQPAMDHYFERIAREILSYEKKNTVHLQKLIIDPLMKLYNYDIKQAENKKRDFEEESRDFYNYVGRYLGQRQDSLKEKKRIESDSKYQNKRRTFELKRFDYSSFMQDLHGGRKEQEVLSHLTRYADAQAKSYLATAKKVEDMMPQLEALNIEVKEADKEYQFQRTEREEKRRTLEKSTKSYVEPDSMQSPPVSTHTSGGYVSDVDLARSDSVTSSMRGNHVGNSSLTPSSSVHLRPTQNSSFGASPTSQSITGMPVQSPSNKFKGIRDLEEREYNPSAAIDSTYGQLRKEGLLWALSRPGSHADPKGLNKQAWHKFWIVLDQGKLSEYSNWKQRLDLHMEPIDLRMATVREARNAERRFCFEVITPHYKRVYQATSEEDMNTWISAINNALQSAVEGRGMTPSFKQPVSPLEGSLRRDIGSVLTGKTSLYGGHGTSRDTSSPNNSVFRRTTVGSRPIYTRSSSNSFEEHPDKLLQIIRAADQDNCWCADCGSGIKTEWVSINLGIVLCIECSGIHRSLGTHVSKVRSLTLDTTSFTTDIVELLLLIGNRVSNSIWEATINSPPEQDASDNSRPPKPTPHANREERLRFITAKYVHHTFIQPLSPQFSHFGTPDETLLASIKKNDIKGMLYALALCASPNATDKSRNTHCLFLALAAADPASPPGSSPTQQSPKIAEKDTAFPAAELLMQNGAEIPQDRPAFPLSKNASLYLEQKSGKMSQQNSGTPRQGNDMVGGLPSIGEGGGFGLLGSGGSPASRDGRLQKRVSAGGRLARSGALIERGHGL